MEKTSKTDGIKKPPRFTKKQKYVAGGIGVAALGAIATIYGITSNKSQPKKPEYDPEREVGI